MTGLHHVTLRRRSNLSAVSSRDGPEGVAALARIWGTPIRVLWLLTPMTPTVRSTDVAIVQREPDSRQERPSPTEAYPLRKEDP